MDIAYIDQLANNGSGYLHKASVLSKVLFCILLLISIIISTNSIELFVIFFILIIITRTNGLPVGKVVHFSLYPAFFSLLFAAMRFYYSFDAGFSVILSAVDGALVMIILITTTPYTKVFSFFGIFLPQIIVNSMFFTYRVFFIIIEKVKNILTIIKLRGGFKATNILFNIKNLAGAIGVLFLNSFDMLERMYNIYALRGYQGSIYMHNKWYKLKRLDFIPMFIGAIILMLVVII